MMKRIISLSFLMIVLSCTDKQKKITSNDTERKPKTILKPESKTKKDSLILEETFIDSLNIGLKGKYKIELQQFRTPDSVFVKMKLFERNKKEWKENQSLEFLKDGITSCDVKIEDFNNDGLCDLTFQSSIAARGANEIRKLFIFNKTKGELGLMKNSAEYPNLEYNKELDCIDAWLVYGGSSTVFLKIDGDSLREFAGVDVGWGEREVYLINKKGERKILRKDKGYEGSQVRFANYKTLEINENY